MIGFDTAKLAGKKRVEDAQLSRKRSV